LWFTDLAVEVGNPQCSSIDENVISVFDINRAVQAMKTRCLTDAKKLNYFNNPASNFKFPAKQYYGSRQCIFQYSWLKKFLMIKVLIANSVCYLVNSVINTSMFFEF